MDDNLVCVWRVLLWRLEEKSARCSYSFYSPHVSAISQNQDQSAFLGWAHSLLFPSPPRPVLVPISLTHKPGHRGQTTHLRSLQCGYDSDPGLWPRRPGSQLPRVLPAWSCLRLSPGGVVRVPRPRGFSSGSLLVTRVWLPSSHRFSSSGLSFSKVTFRAAQLLFLFSSACFSYWDAYVILGNVAFLPKKKKTSLLTGAVNVQSTWKRNSSVNSIRNEAQISAPSSFCQCGFEEVIERAAMLYWSANILFYVKRVWLKKKNLCNFPLLEKLQFSGLQYLSTLMRNIQGEHWSLEGKNTFSVSRQRYSCVVSGPNYENYSAFFLTALTRAVRIIDALLHHWCAEGLAVKYDTC